MPKSYAMLRTSASIVIGPQSIASPLLRASRWGASAARAPDTDPQSAARGDAVGAGPRSSAPCLGQPSYRSLCYPPVQSFGERGEDDTQTAQPRGAFAGLAPVAFLEPRNRDFIRARAPIQGIEPRVHARNVVADQMHGGTKFVSINRRHATLQARLQVREKLRADLRQGQQRIRNRRIERLRDRNQLIAIGRACRQIRLDRRHDGRILRVERQEQSVALRSL